MTGFTAFLSEEQCREYEAVFPSSAKTQYPAASPSSFAYAQESSKKYTTSTKKDKGKAKAHEPVGTLFTMDEFEEDDLVSDGGGGGGFSQQFKGCFGCHQEGHGLGSCPTIRELINKGDLKYDQEAHKLSLPDGRPVRCYMDESLVEAAQRMQGGTGPRVMLGLIDSVVWEPHPAQSYYHEESHRTHIEEVYTESEEELIIEEDSDTDSGTFYIEAMEQQGYGTTPHKIYLTVPREIKEISSPMVQAAERGPKEIRTACKEVFDGVQVTARDKSKTQALKNPVKDMFQDSGKPENNDRPPQPASKMTKTHEFAPKETPVDAWKARSDPPSQDVQMKDATPSGNSGKTGL
ncbi:hypothetical protein C8J57DRAFT_1217130 [Mycena rebaudengoi]|nr:hypothetical protein C8J57DRAFT_1217130 [Mycena rebaudengoi]